MGSSRVRSPYSRLVVEWHFPADDGDPFERIARLPKDSGPIPRKQHVVSQALLKGFATPGSSGKGWTLTPYDVVHRRAHRPQGLRGCAYVRDFIVYAAQSAELAWKSVEDELPVAIAAARSGDLHRDSNARLRDVLTDAIALHFVRTPRLLREQARLTAKTTSEVRTRTLLEQEAMLKREFVKRYGLVPAGTEALEAVLDVAMEPWREVISNGALARVTLESLFERIRTGLRGLPLEVWHTAPGSELLISDNAAFTFVFSDDGRTAETNMAFGDSQGAALPLARDCLIAIGRTRKEDVLTPQTASLLNSLQVRHADAFVYFRPGSGLEATVEAAVQSRQ